MTRLTRNSFPLAAAILLWAIAPAASLESRAPSAFAQSAKGDGQASALIAEGAAALERGDVSGAKIAFERALRINPKDATAHTYLGVLSERAGQLDLAERHFASAVATDPSSPGAHNNYGAILLRLGRADQAAAEFETSLSLNKSQPSALVNLAQIRFAGNDPERLREARDLFERARALAPDAEISRALIIITLRLNDRTAAASNYRDYKQRLANAHEAVTAPPARVELGAALLAAGLSVEASEELTAAVSADPANVSAILLLGRAHLALKDIPAAGRALESAVARGVDSAQIYAALAEVYEASGHVENAIPAMRLAIERDPKKEDYRFRYAMILTDTKAPAAAIIRLEEALKEFPRSAKLWFALGVAHSANYRSDEAAKAFERAIELDPKLAPAIAYLGMTRAEQGQYDEAIELYKRALAIDERLAPAHFLIADMMSKQASSDSAVIESHLARAIELDASLNPARLALAKLYLRAGKVKEATAELERLVAAEPGLAEPHYQLGRAYMRLKRRAEADAEFARFQKLSESEKAQAQSERRAIARRLANVRF